MAIKCKEDSIFRGHFYVLPFFQYLLERGFKIIWPRYINPFFFEFQFARGSTHYGREILSPPLFLLLKREFKSLWPWCVESSSFFSFFFRGSWTYYSCILPANKNKQKTNKKCWDPFNPLSFPINVKKRGQRFIAALVWTFCWFKCY